MTRCAQCRAVIISGGIRAGGQEYCDGGCYRKGYLKEVAKQFPPEEIDRRTMAIYNGPCPKCSAEGTVDYRAAHYIWSIILFTRVESDWQLTCRACARKRSIDAAGFCAAFGWWGIPLGILATPIQIARNLFALRKEIERPSRDLRNDVILQLISEHEAAKAKEAQQQPWNQTGATNSATQPS